MKKILRFFIFPIFFYLFSFGFCFAASYEENIENFDVIAQINNDSSVDIVETIEYNFASNEKHGIYRKIPIVYKNDGIKSSIKISDISVYDQSGNAYDFSVSKGGSYEVIKIGNSNSFVTGLKTYIINYKVERAINFFENSDEFYWNVTGNDWEVPIKNASVEVVFPESIEEKLLEKKCFSGFYGSSEECASTYLNTTDNYIDSISFSERGMLSGQGVTVAVSIPKNIIKEPSSLYYFSVFIKDNFLLFIPFLFILLFTLLWFKNGKDPDGKGSIIVQFEAPDDLTPAEAGTIVDEKCAQKELVSEFINLAVKGYIRIKRTEEKILFVKKTDYTFEKIKEYKEVGNEHERELFYSIFNQDSEVSLSDLKNDFYKDYQKFQKLCYEAVTQKGYFLSNPNKARASFTVKYIALVFVLAVAYSIISGSSITEVDIISCSISIFIIVIFSLIMPKKTKKGVFTKENILGFKRYLSVAEKDRLDFHNAPEKNPEQFEKFLPYAIVLGVEKKWAEQFEGIYNENPIWFQSGSNMTMQNFAIMNFIGDLGDFSNNVIASSAPASSGGSGVGGGFSGGGFGGGGGGSW